MQANAASPEVERLQTELVIHKVAFDRQRSKWETIQSRDVDENLFVSFSHRSRKTGRSMQRWQWQWQLTSSARVRDFIAR